MQPLIKFQAKLLQLYSETPAYVVFVERRETATSEISSKNQNSRTG